MIILYDEFRGHIVNWDINAEEGLALITCLDFSNLFTYRINENWPDKASYWSAGYVGAPDRNQPDGIEKPIAYDGWEFGKAISEMILDEPEGMIVDLRYNGGGYLDIAIELLSYLLPSDTEAVIVKQRGLEDDGQDA